MPLAAPAPALDLCQAGVVLRVVLFVEGVLGVACLFGVSSVGPWLHAVAIATGGALPATLFWLAASCAFQRVFAPFASLAPYVVLGALAGGLGWGVLRWAGEGGSSFWLAWVLAGALFSALVMMMLAGRARARTPGAAHARLAELQSRIRPHFLFNTLNSAIALVRAEPAKAEAMLEDLSELFRHALADPDESVTLADEIGLAERYLAIEQVRFGDRLKVRWDLDAAAGEARLPSLLLQPLVENAVKHGVEPSPQGAGLRIRTERRGRRVLIEVINSLPPLRWADAPLPRGHGIALVNVRDRLRLLHDVRARLWAGVDQGSYRVCIEIPVTGQDRRQA